MLTITKSMSSKTTSRLPQPVQGQAVDRAPLKVLVVDDHCLMREVLRDLLKQLKGNAMVMEAANGHQAIQLVAERQDIDLILLDMNVPDRDGFTILNWILAHHPKTSVVTLFDHPDRATTVKALNLGALGVIPKAENRQIILGALRIVLSGGIYIPREILNREQLAAKPANIKLTDRQHDILALMMHGKCNKAICRDLQLAMPTVKNHVTAILKALNVRNRTEAVIAASILGWPFSRSNRPQQAVARS